MGSFRWRSAYSRPRRAGISVRFPSQAEDRTIVSLFMKKDSGVDDHPWAFVTNYSHVLVCLAADPRARLRDIAETVGVTERTAAQLVSNLEQAGYLTKTRHGRRNQYEIHDELPLRHPQHRHHTVRELIRFLAAPATDGDSVRSGAPA